MADVYTGTSALSTDTAAYDRLAYFAYRPELFWDDLADVKPTNQTHNGATVTFTKYTEMAAATTALSEAVDVDAVAIADAQVTVTLVEYGNASIPTAKVRATSYIPLDPVIANLIGYNAGISIDTIARTAAMLGTNVRYVGQTARASLAATNVLTAAEVRRQRAALVGANVPSFGGLYNAIIHPDVSYDLRGETGAAAWRDPHTYSQPQEIWNGEVGSFEGFRFMESPRAFSLADAGAGSTVDVYATHFIGRGGFAKAFSTGGGYGPNPVVVIGPIVDKLMRFRPIGWKHFVGYKVFREEAIRRIESASTLATNV
jgi:N4-gp56 family major capsid protein